MLIKYALKFFPTAKPALKPIILDELTHIAVCRHYDAKIIKERDECQPHHKAI